MKIPLKAIVTAGLLVIATTSSAEKSVDLQKQFNEQVMKQPFSVENDANLNAYIEDATRRGIPPRSQPSKHWRQGYTCADLRRYSWTDYRDCSYYYQYYGYYWPY